MLKSSSPSVLARKYLSNIKNKNNKNFRSVPEA